MSEKKDDHNKNAPKQDQKPNQAAPQQQQAASDQNKAPSTPIDTPADKPVDKKA